MTTENKQQDKSKRYLIAIIIVLLLMNGFFIYQYVNTDRELTTATENLMDTQDAKDELDQLLKEANQQLEQYKGRNEALDEEIRLKQEELQAKADSIAVLLKDKKISKRQMEKVMNELGKYKWYVKKYQGQIDSLSHVNANLLKKNQEIARTLDSQKMKNENLTMKNITLENKVNLGKKLSFTKLEFLPVNRRKSGRETETTRASRVDLLKVEFTLDVNYLADLGPKDFYLKVITPEGSTLSSENTGGGMFRFQGDESLYTMKHTMDFDNTGQTTTFYYEKGSEWKEGDYTIELYSDGFLIGSEKLKLR